MDSEILCQLKYRSDEFGIVMGAYAKAQGAFKPLVADSTSPKGRYSSLRAIRAATCDALAANSLAFYQGFEFFNNDATGIVLLKTTLGHESNQWIASYVRVISEKTHRETDTLVEGLKRSQALMLLGIAPSEGDPTLYDDNFETLAEQSLINEVRKPRALSPKITDSRAEEINYNNTISDTQYQELLIELEDQESLLTDILQVYGISTLADLPASEYHKAMAKIRRIKRVAEDYQSKKGS
jgi:hypothetical protein